MSYRVLIIVMLLFSGVLVLAHQALISDGVWFELDQFLHHENIAAVIIAFACGMLFNIATKRNS